MHVYILIDTSASMYGAPLQAIQNSTYPRLHQLVSEIFGANVRSSALTYNSQVEVLWADRMLADQTLPNLDAGGTSALGQALKWLYGWRTTSSSREALALVLTDGCGTDDWQNIGMRLKSERLLLIGIGCGLESRVDLLTACCTEVMLWHDFDNHQLRTLLSKWRTTLTEA